MRKIKFRQWIKDKFYYFELKDGKCGGVVSASLKQYPIYQFSELFDINGKEIYEGDIIEWFDHNNKKLIGPVIFERGSFYFLKSKGFKYQLSVCACMTMHSNPCRVIGNINENKDLLE